MMRRPFVIIQQHITLKNMIGNNAIIKYVTNTASGHIVT